MSLLNNFMRLFDRSGGYVQDKNELVSIAALPKHDIISSMPIFTAVPGREPIELVSYYEAFSTYYLNCELQTKRWFVENIAPDWVMFDVGANIGYYSILFSQLASRGKVYAFEPTQTLDLLQTNLIHHQCHNVEIMQLALGATSGRVEENIYRIWGHPPERLPYDFSTIDEIVKDKGITRLDCVKIDCDSFDFEVLRGGSEAFDRFNPYIVVELNHALALRNQSVPEALQWLMARGYEQAHVLDHENFMLRRPEISVTPPSTTMRLSFETRPVILAPPQIAGT